MSKPLHRLGYDDASLGTSDTGTEAFPSGFQRLWISGSKAEEILAGHEVSYDGVVYSVISKGEQRGPNMVAFTVSYERSDTPTVAESDDEWADIIFPEERR